MLANTRKMLFSLFLTMSVSLVASSPARSGSPAADCSEWRNQVNKYGAQVFMLGDRNFTVPKDVAEIDAVTCPRLKEAADGLKDVFRSCLRPFPKTVAGLAIRGARKAMKDRCGSQKEKETIIKYLACVRPQERLDLLHEIMEDISNKLLYAQKNVPLDRMLGLGCCVYHDLRQFARETASKFCTPDAVKYTDELIDEMLQEALDIACASFAKDEHKCTAIKKRDPFPEHFNATTRAKDTFLLTLLDVLTAIADADL